MKLVRICILTYTLSAYLQETLLNGKGFMNLSELTVGGTIIETIIGTIIGGLVLTAILAIIRFIWKKRSFIATKIKSTRLFHFLLKAKGTFLDICGRLFQPEIEIKPKVSLPDYVKSFGTWKSKSGAGIMLSVKVETETTIYNNVTSVRVSRIDPFTPLYELDIELEKPGYALYHRTILGISYSEIYRLARMFYFREIVENYNNPSCYQQILNV